MIGDVLYRMSELALVALPVLYLWHHCCHAPRCVRLGHPNELGVVVCRRHIEFRW